MSDASSWEKRFDRFVEPEQALAAGPTRHEQYPKPVVFELPGAPRAASALLVPNPEGWGRGVLLVRAGSTFFSPYIGCDPSLL